MRPVLATVLAAALLAAAGCGAPSDAVATGSICVPARSQCPSERLLTRRAEGRNLLDIAIDNQGPKATVLLRAASTASTDALVPDDSAAAGDTGPGGGFSIFPVTYRLDSGERATDRFRSTEIFSQPQLHLQLRCRACPDCTEPCRARLEYVFMVEADECNSDDDCSGDNLCDESAGICVECLVDGDCQPDQQCDRATGRCQPPDDSGCRQADGAPPPWWLLLLGGLALWWLRRPRRGARATAAGLLLALVLTPSPTRSAPPGSTLSLGTGPRWVAGPIGENVQRGLGLQLHETVRWTYGGVSAWIGADYFVTNQPPPPLVRELQIFAFGIGPRAYYSFGPVELMAGAGYQRLGFAPNALVRHTGVEANFNSFGGTFGVGYRWSRFVVRLDGSLYPILEVDGSLVSTTLSFGISTR